MLTIFACAETKAVRKYSQVKECIGNIAIKTLMKFIWNKEKSEANLKKHHISFDLAIYLFADSNRVEIYDQKHSVDEERFITIGYVENIPLFVVYTVVDDQAVRIISARKALRIEVERYYPFQNRRKICI